MKEQQKMTQLQLIEKELLRREAERELARRHLIDFLKLDGKGNFFDPPHIRFMADKVQKAFEGEIKRLIISIPPRHGKSELSTKKAPAWGIGKYPDNELIMASYSQEMIEGFSRMARNTFIEHAQNIFGLNISKDQASVKEWGVEGHRGVCKASGIGGAITGKGGKVIIVDDVCKDWESAQSKLQRDKIWDWYRTVLRTRLAPGGSIIIIMTRWHVDDLAGRLLEEAKNGGEQWEEIKLKAIAEEDDPMGRKPGEALWHTRYPIEELLALKRTMGNTMFNALYQQSPVNMDGGVFKGKYFKYWEQDGNFLKLIRDGEIYKTFMLQECRKMVTVDTALKANEQNDYTVFNYFIETPEKDMLIADMFRDRLEVPDQYSAFKDFVWKHSPDIIGVEDKQSGTGLIQAAIREGFPISVLQANTDKVVRASTAAIYYENGKVYHRKPSEASWVGLLESELSEFPGGAHDDMVDTVSYGALLIRDTVQVKNRAFGKLKNIKT